MRLQEDKVNLLKIQFQTHQGVLKTQDLYEFGLNYRNINTLVNKQILKRMKNGYYCLQDESISEVGQIHGLFPDGVLTMESALYYYGYIQEKPFCWYIAVDKNTSKSRFKLSYPVVCPYYTQSDCLELGKEKIEIQGLTFFIYDKERLICDCLKYESKLSHEVLRQAIQSYIKEPHKDLEKLSYYARLRKVATKVEQIIGVWL